MTVTRSILTTAAWTAERPKRRWCTDDVISRERERLSCWDKQTARLLEGWISSVDAMPITQNRSFQYKIWPNTALSNIPRRLAWDWTRASAVRGPLSSASVARSKTGTRITFVQPLLQWKGNKYFICWVCVCSLRYPACNAHAPYCHLRPARLYNIFYSIS